jgi:hypothetical protein
MFRVTLLAICAASMVGACNARRKSDPLAHDTSFTPVPSQAPSASAAVAPAPAPALALRTVRASTANHDGEVNPTAAKTFLVWARDAHGQPFTYRLDRTGEERERLPGVYVGTRAGTWHWQEEDVEVPTKACPRNDEEEEDAAAPEGPAPGHATRVTLALAGGSNAGGSNAGGSNAKVQRVVDPLSPAPSPAKPADADPDSDGAVTAEDHERTDEEGDVLQNAEEVRHLVSLAGSIGPYLFFEESTYAYTCGAHGSTTVTSRIWNAATGRIEPMPADFGPLPNAITKAAQELTEDDDPFPATDENLELTALVPHYGSHAGLRIGLQFSAPTCYACTRGGGSSYTKSTVVDAAGLPKLFSRYAAPPQAVRAWIAAHPDEHLGGFSGLGG